MKGNFTEGLYTGTIYSERQCRIDIIALAKRKNQCDLRKAGQRGGKVRKTKIEISVEDWMKINVSE